MKNSFIRFAIKGATLYVVVECFLGMRKENIVRKANLIRQQQHRYGSQFELTQQKQKVLDEADQYLQEHAGMRYMNRSKPREYLEERIKTLLGQKEEQMQKLKDKQENDPQIQEIKKQVEKLNQIYTQIRPKYTTLQQMAQPDIEVDKDKYHQRI